MSRLGGGVARLPDYATVEEAYLAFLTKAGFRELTRTIRGLVR